MCIAYEFVDRHSEQSGRVKFQELELCKYGRPGQPCTNFRTLEMPSNRDGTLQSRRQHSISRRASSNGSPRGRRLPSELPSDEAAAPATRPTPRSEIMAHPSDRRTHRQERRNPQERILVVNTSSSTPRISPKSFVKSPSPLKSPDRLLYYSTRGRAVVVDERPLRRLTRSPTPFSYDGEKRRGHPRPVSTSRSRERGRTVYRRSYNRPDAYDWTSPSRRHDSWFVAERRGRRQTYGGRDALYRRGSHAGPERRGRRITWSEPETHEKKPRKSTMSAFYDPVGQVRVEKKRIRKAGASESDRDDRRETRTSYSDPERELRRERRARRSSSSAHDKEVRRRRSSLSDHNHTEPHRSLSTDVESGRKPKRLAFPDQERDDWRPSLDHERRERRGSVLVPVIVENAEPRRERRIGFASDVEEIPHRGRRSRRSSEAEREARRERREQREQRRATYPILDVPQASHRTESTPRLAAEPERLAAVEVHSSYSDPGRQTSPDRERDDRARDKQRRRLREKEERAYYRSEKLKRQLIAEQDDEIRNRPAKPSLKPILKQSKRDDDLSSAPTQSKVVTIDEGDMEAEEALKRRQEDRRRLAEDKDREAQRHRLRSRLTRSSGPDEPAGAERRVRGEGIVSEIADRGDGIGAY